MMSLRSSVSVGLATMIVMIVLAGCSGSGGITPVGGASLAMPASTSPGAIAPAPMARTAIQSPAVMNARPQGAIQGANWTQIPGSASLAAGAPDGSLWVLSDLPAGPDKYIWHYSGGNWTNVSGLASRLSVAPDGTLYAINSGGGAYSYSGGTWTGLGGGASDITAASDGSIYVLSNGASAGSDQAIWHYTTSWSQTPGAGVRIAASWDKATYSVPGGVLLPNGLYIINSHGSIYYENSGGSFATLPGAASAIAPITVGGAFGLGYPGNSGGNTIYYYDLNTPGWSVQGGAGVSLSANTSALYVIGASGAIYSSPIARTTPPTPTLAAEYSIPSSGSLPSSITAGSDGNLWFTESSTNKVGRISTGGSITEFAIPTPQASPQGITAGPDGNVWFAEESTTSNNIARITPGGTFTEFSIPTVTAFPTDLVTGPDGNVWFAENHLEAPKIGRVSPSGAFTEFPLSINNPPFAIVAGSDGNLWFTEPGGIYIGRMTPSGAVTEFTIPSLSTGVFMVAGPDGNLWFTEPGGNRIAKITTAGTVTEYTIPTASSAPEGIASGSDGNLWFTESSANQIGRITPAGVITEYPVATANSAPAAIAAGPDGNLWFTEYNGNKIGKFIP